MSFTPRGSSLNSPDPPPNQGIESHHAPSVVSSRLTDVISEDGDEYYPEGAAAAAAQSRARAFAGDQERTMSLQRRQGVSGAGGSGEWRPGNAFGGLGATMSNTSRPQSAMSRGSRTHVPSLTSHAFFRPMSSQRLQAQRGGRPITSGQTGTGSAGQSNIGSTFNRQSIGSNQTEYQDNDLPPPSRGTEYTEHDPRDRASINPSPSGNVTAQSLDESTRPLHKRSSFPGPVHLDFGAKYKPNPNGVLQAQKSTGSFRSAFILPARENPLPSNRQQRKQPSSKNTSLEPEHSKVFSATKTQAGKNYQYFAGNTVFLLRGRFQNARQKPINIATGVLVVLPSVLFLVYSYVLPCYIRKDIPSNT